MTLDMADYMNKATVLQVFSAYIFFFPFFSLRKKKKDSWKVAEMEIKLTKLKKKGSGHQLSLFLVSHFFYHLTFWKCSHFAVSFIITLEYCLSFVLKL